MRRDMETIRELLLWMETQEDDMFSYIDFPPLPDTETTIAHVKMLESGGYIDRNARDTLRISWEGHEFLDKIRDPEIWRKTKAGAAQVGSWSVKLLGDLAMGFIRVKAAELGLPLA